MKKESRYFLRRRNKEIKAKTDSKKLLKNIAIKELLVTFETIHRKI
jgi:hypothetical protein